MGNQKEGTCSTDIIRWNGHLLLQQENCGKVQCEHFQMLLKIPGDIDHQTLDNIPQRITTTSLDEIPTMDVMSRAIAGLKDDKAPAGDGIHAEVWKHGGDNLFSRLHQLITNAW